MAVALIHIRDELFPGLAAIGRARGYKIETYKDFATDKVVIIAGRARIEITAAEMEDGKHIRKLANLMELLMCSKGAGAPARMDAVQARLQVEMQQQLKRSWMADNPYREMFQLAKPAKPKAAPKPHDPRTLDLEPTKPVNGHAAAPAPDLIFEDK